MVVVCCVNYYVEMVGDSVEVFGNIMFYGMLVKDFLLYEMIEMLIVLLDYVVCWVVIVEWNVENLILKKGIVFVFVKFGIFFMLIYFN